MESLGPAESDRASEVSLGLDDGAMLETALDSEEAEELAQSLKEAMHTEDVKPKLQCLLSNPDFSMVTVQCEDSGIHWETSSSRCSTPWASEASTTSDVYSMESSSAGTPPGKVIFIMDEGKLRRKKVRPSPSSKFPRQSSHHKKSVDNPKQSADNMRESFKQALEKAKRHLSTHTEEAGNTDSATKNTEECTTQVADEPELNSGSDNTGQEQNAGSGAAETSKDSPEETVAQSKSVDTEPEVTAKSNFMKSDSAGSAPRPTETVPEKQIIEPVKKQPRELNTMKYTKYKGRVPQSLAENTTVMTSSKHDIDSYPPYVLLELSSVLENIAKLCNPSKDALTQDNANIPPTTESNVFSIVSDGSEILNIMAPDLISSVDQEASKAMQDRLEYLEENPMLIPKPLCNEDDVLPTNNYEEPDEKDNEMAEEDVKTRIPENIQSANPDKATNEIDYFEKFTLIDTKIPIDHDFKKSSQELDIGHVTLEHQPLSLEGDVSFDDSYLLQSLDESFYGVSESENFIIPQRSSDKSIVEEEMEKQDKAMKTNGVSLFSEEEGVLTKSFFFPTSYPINPELLEEPPALAFLYTDLYEQARGSKTIEGHDQSDAESTSSAATFHSRISDDDGTGIYFEKFNLKDDIPEGAGKQEEEDFYSQEDSDEDQYLSYEDLPDESSFDKEHIQSTTNKEERGTTAFPKIDWSEISQTDDTAPLLDKTNTVSLGSMQNADVAIEESLDHKRKMNIEVPDYEQKENKLQYEREVKSDDKANLGNDIKKVSPKQGPVMEEQECIGDDEEIAESLDYVIVSQDDFEDDDDILLKELTFEDQDSLEHGSELFLDTVQEFPPEHEDAGFEIIEHIKKTAELSERPQEEDSSQIDTYCNTCKIPIVAIDKIFGDHKNHDVTTLDNAVNLMTRNLEDLLEKLQASSLKTEDFVTRVEALFNEVEKNCAEAEKHLVEENEEMVEKVVARHKEKRESFEEVKKMKMDYLYDQMVSFQQNVDSAKESLEKAAKEMDELDSVAFLNTHNDINDRLLKAIESTLPLDKMSSAFSIFDHLAANSPEADQKTAKRVPALQTPKVKEQEPSSATSTSVTVYWTVNEEDIIEFFQVYCMEEPQGKSDDNGLLEEYRVTVRESFCILEDLEPDKRYSVWVMAVNDTSCSLPSDKSIFRTAPSTPVIKAEDCTVCWDTAVIRWSTARSESTESFTLEWCKQYSSEGEGLRSVSGIKEQQLRVTLQPGENYFFYVKAANTFGSSEQSEAALISTKGTRFHLLRDTAHPTLDLSADGTVISIAEKSEITGIPLVLGELLPAKGRHYWEMTVPDCSAYSVGATFHPSPEEYALSQDRTSWCMQCSCSSTSFSYRFLHNEVRSEVNLTEPPFRVGILLDYRKGGLSFYNVQRGQLLFTFRHKFTEAAHPTFALEAHGEIHLHTGIEMPHFAKHN
ncbi:cardiomyopathy-associated protein 5 [Pseudophryne corroboree]|uniref:cardiomyopathy-associated protein 5 n=1 Tax=Pseudophryne corroboree TaxID=495146 RepID=UPI003081CC80